MIGLDKEAILVPVGTGEGPLAVAEQLAFEDMLRQGRTVYRHHSSSGPAGHGMQGPGRQFLAGPGFTADQHGHAARGQTPQQVLDLQQARRIPDKTIEIAAAGKLVPQFLNLLFSRRSSVRSMALATAWRIWSLSKGFWKKS